MDPLERMNLVDSDVLIEIQRATPESVTWLKSFEGELALPAAVAWELLMGSRNANELKRSQDFLSTFRVEELDSGDSALARSLIIGHSLSAGLSIPDYLITAQALNRSATLLTFNLRHFSVIPGLNAMRMMTEVLGLCRRLV